MSAAVQCHCGRLRGISSGMQSTCKSTQISTGLSVQRLDFFMTTASFCGFEYLSFSWWSHIVSAPKTSTYTLPYDTKNEKKNSRDADHVLQLRNIRILATNPTPPMNCYEITDWMLHVHTFTTLGIWTLTTLNKSTTAGNFSRAYEIPESDI